MRLASATMDVRELLTEAWSAVEQSGVPTALHEVAFREAVAVLRAASDAANTTPPPTAGRDRPSAASSTATDEAGGDADEDQFFRLLAHESGLPEEDLRDIMTLHSDGSVIVTVPTKDLGRSTAEQARTVTALVASARGKGLNEKPVAAEAVRKEVARKGCYDRNNYSGKALGPLKGFGYGATNKDIVVNSKWVAEFAAAVSRAHGRTGDAAG
jgi:hypothetical protein